MSRIYDNKPLSNLSLTNVSHKEWNRDTMTRGDGVLLEGVVKKRSHVSININDGTKFRYYLLHLEVRRAHKRRFDSSGKEVTPNFSETHKVGGGYLNTYKVEAKGQTDRINNKDVKQLLEVSDVEAIYRKTPSLVSEGCISLWLPENQIESIDVLDHDSLRITTKGNSPFIENLTKMEAETPSVSNFAGESVGANWTDKIMSMKSEGKDTTQEEENDAEWDD